MKKIIGMLMGVFVMLPVGAHAYEVLETTAVKVADNAYMYTITYQLGFEKFAISAPIGAMRASGDTPTTPYLEYQILEDGEVSEVVVSNAFVFSDAEIIDAEYFIPKGEGRRFKLVALLVTPDDYVLNESALQVTSLPFLLDSGTETIENGLSLGELSYYRTSIAD